MLSFTWVTYSYLIDGETESHVLSHCVLAPAPCQKKMLPLVLAGDNHRRPLRCSDHMNSKDKPDLDGEIRERALQLADAG